MKKILTVTLILFFLQNCGYKPIYSKNEKINFYISELNLNFEDRELYKFIKSNLINYNESNYGKEYIVTGNGKYLKNIASKNRAGDVEEYEISTFVEFVITSNSKTENFEVSETFNIKNLDDEFEEEQYEKSIKENMAQSITNQLIFRLSTFNDN